LRTTTSAKKTGLISLHPWVSDSARVPKTMASRSAAKTLARLHDDGSTQIFPCIMSMPINLSLLLDPRWQGIQLFTGSTGRSLRETRHSLLVLVQREPAAQPANQTSTTTTRNLTAGCVASPRAGVRRGTNTEGSHQEEPAFSRHRPPGRWRLITFRRGGIYGWLDDGYTGAAWYLYQGHYTKGIILIRALYEHLDQGTGLRLLYWRALWLY
jgi:hypothetical protein